MTETITPGSIEPRIRFIGDGNTKEFIFPFEIFSEQDVEIYFTDTLQTSGFGVVKYPSDNGGIITFDTAPKAGTIITIARNLEIKRTTDFSESKAFRAKMLNHEFDYQIACLKQITDNIKRTIALPPYSDGDVDLKLPLPKAGKALMWDENGTHLRNSLINIDDIDAVEKAKQEAQKSQKEAEKILQDIIELSTQVLNNLEGFSSSDDEKANVSMNNLSAEAKANLKKCLAPLAQEEAGMGQFAVAPVSFANSTANLPDGGTWLVFVFATDLNATLLIRATFSPSGLYPGGSVISTPSSYVRYLAWRVA